MEADTAFVVDAEASKAREPNEGSFHDPPVSAKMGAAVYPASRDPWLDATGTAFPGAASMIVAPIGVQFVRALAGPTTASGSHALHDVQRLG